MPVPQNSLWIYQTKEYTSKIKMVDYTTPGGLADAVFPCCVYGETVDKKAADSYSTCLDVINKQLRFMGIHLSNRGWMIIWKRYTNVIIPLHLATLEEKFLKKVKPENICCIVQVAWDLMVARRTRIMLLTTFVCQQFHRSGPLPKQSLSKLIINNAAYVRDVYFCVLTWVALGSFLSLSLQK